MVDWLVRATATVAPTAVNMETGKARRWRIHFPKLAPVEVWFTPEVTREEALAACDGAIETLPMHDRAKRAATAAEADELRKLVRAILADASEIERSEALAAALADPVAALPCFRAIREGR